MRRLAIRAQGLGKEYHIGALQRRGYRTLRETITDGLTAPLRKAGRLLRGQATGAAGLDESMWALRDVSFEVREGEVVGIVGRNGAGKSTLLKVLSRITVPTEGMAEIRGRVGSLLEVGTGFHPELTGRENVYLNGAILGMTRAEIARKFDGIVDFAETDKFVDTPVKHYSSGMIVRLAFAVAAHLEPEILLIDEVLAVGDIGFQRKCLGKMEEVAGEGRTVLFISHQMPMVESLCERVILLEDGRVVEDGPTRQVLATYLEGIEGLERVPLADRKDRRGEGLFRAVDIDVLDADGRPLEHAFTGQEIRIRLHYESQADASLRDARVNILVQRNGHTHFVLATEVAEPQEVVLRGSGLLEVRVPELPLSGGVYDLTTYIGTGHTIHDFVERAGRLSVVDGDYFGTGRNYVGGMQGEGVLVRHSWTVPDPSARTRVRA